MRTTQHSYPFRFNAATRAGRAVVGAFAVHVALLAAFVVVVASGQRGGDAFFDNPWLSVPILLAGVAGVAAGALALYALARLRDWAMANVLVAIYGLLVVAFIAGELLSSH